jgi:hypothetical protein
VRKDGSLVSIGPSLSGNKVRETSERGTREEAKERWDETSARKV